MRLPSVRLAEAAEVLPHFVQCAEVDLRLLLVGCDDLVLIRSGAGVSARKCEFVNDGVWVTGVPAKVTIFALLSAVCIVFGRRAG